MIERQRLGELIKEVIRRHRLDRRAAQQAALGLWPEVVGHHIARNAWPLGVREGVLLVGAANHAWAQTLHLMRAQIVDAVNARIAQLAGAGSSAPGLPSGQDAPGPAGDVETPECGCAALPERASRAPSAALLRDMKVRVARREQRPGVASTAADTTHKRGPLPPLTREDQQRVRDLAAVIEDPELRVKVARAAAGLLRLRRQREAQGWHPCPRCGRSFRGHGRTCPACAARR